MVEFTTILDRASAIADDVLFPEAQQVDQATTLPAGHLDALARAGLFGLAGPNELGFLDLDPTEARQVIATIAGGCGATFFVWVQHHGVVRTVRSSSNAAVRDELLVPLCRGELVAGVAFAHVRRPGGPAVRAERIDGGWRIDGHAPWATSWGIADWFAVAAESAAGELVWLMLPGDASDGVRADPLRLPVLGATGTVTLTFDRCVVPDERVAHVEDAAHWRRLDRRRSATGQTAVLGVAGRAIDVLRTAARAEGDPAHVAADRLDSQLAERWRVDRSLAAAPSDRDAGRADATIARASDHRAACLDLGRRATTALLAAVGGAGMGLDHPAQRLAREATFYVIQAQTADGRAATLHMIAE